MDSNTRQELSVHEGLIACLRDSIQGRSVVLDAWTSGTEEVILLLRMEGTSQRSDRAELHLLLLSPYPLFWLSPAARRRSSADSGLGDWLRRRLIGAAVADVSSGQSGRILRLDLQPPSSGETATIPLLLDPGANACRFIVLDPEGLVEQRFPPPIHARPTGRGAPGQLYAEPAAGFREPWQRIARTDDGAHGAQLRAPRPQLWICRSAAESGRPDSAGIPPIFLSPLPCPPAASLADPLDAPAAAQEAGRLWIRFARHREAARLFQQALRSEGKHLRRLTARLATETEEAAQGQDLRRQAEALLANPGRVPKGAREARLDDPSAPGHELLIKLDPALSFAQNAAKIFRRAGRLERALPLRKRRMEQTQRLARSITDWLEQLDRDPLIPAGITRLVEELRGLRAGLEPGLARRWADLARRSRQMLAVLDTPIDRGGYEARQARADAGRTIVRPERHPREATAGIHPRRFELPGGWVVLVARSSRENDILTHKVAAPRDLWLHAQGVAGSHVILRRAGRKDNPSRRILEQAAAIAAHYSKARTSGMAAVIYTERRYVRKPRKARPGLALCTREKTLMVVPGLPEGGESEVENDGAAGINP